MSLTRLVIAESARELKLKCDVASIEVNSCFVTITTTADAMVGSATPASSGDGLYYANMLMPGTSSGDYYRVTWHMMHGTLASGGAATWKSTMLLNVVLEGEN